jgi:hypothetical protein
MLCYGDDMVMVESQRPEDLHGSHTGQGVDLPGRRRRPALPPGLGRRCREAELVTARYSALLQRLNCRGLIMVRRGVVIAASGRAMPVV